jgi:hypothetical protein
MAQQPLDPLDPFVQSVPMNIEFGGGRSPLPVMCEPDGQRSQQVNLSRACAQRRQQFVAECGTRRARQEFEQFRPT